jgi:hypothetical protein
VGTPEPTRFAAAMEGCSGRRDLARGSFLLSVGPAHMSTPLDNGSADAKNLLKKNARPLPSGPPELPVMNPSVTDFEDLPGYLRSLDGLGRQHGAVKVVPPGSYAARVTYENYDTLIRSVASQSAEGEDGFYELKLEDSGSMFMSDLERIFAESEAESETQWSSNIRTAEIEFWRNVGLGDSAAAYTGQSPQSSLFDKSNRPWNLGSLRTHKRAAERTGAGRSARATAQSALGLGMGMAGTARGWSASNEPNYIIQYLHKGAPRTIYAVTPAHRKPFEALVGSFRAQFSEDGQTLDPNNLDADLKGASLLIDPTVVSKRKISLFKTTQLAGEFVVHWPESYFCSFSHGINYFEAVEYSLGDADAVVDLPRGHWRRHAVGVELPQGHEAQHASDAADKLSRESVQHAHRTNTPTDQREDIEDLARAHQIAARMGGKAMERAQNNDDSQNRLHELSAQAVAVAEAMNAHQQPQKLSSLMHTMQQQMGSLGATQDSSLVIPRSAHSVSGDEVAGNAAVPKPSHIKLEERGFYHEGDREAHSRKRLRSPDVQKSNERLRAGDGVGALGPGPQVLLSGGGGNPFMRMNNNMDNMNLNLKHGGLPYGGGGMPMGMAVVQPAHNMLALQQMASMQQMAAMGLMNPHSSIGWGQTGLQCMLNLSMHNGGLRKLESSSNDGTDKNKNCHFCEHAPKRCAIFACANLACDQMFCENCCKRHLGRPTSFKGQHDALAVDWRCPICTKQCCCTKSICSENHLHCKRYRRKMKHWGRKGNSTADVSIKETGELSPNEGLSPRLDVDRPREAVKHENEFLGTVDEDSEAWGRDVHEHEHHNLSSVNTRSANGRAAFVADSMGEHLRTASASAQQGAGATQAPRTGSSSQISIHIPAPGQLVNFQATIGHPSSSTPGRSCCLTLDVCCVSVCFMLCV